MKFFSLCWEYNVDSKFTFWNCKKMKDKRQYHTKLGVRLVGVKKFINQHNERTLCAMGDPDNNECSSEGEVGDNSNGREGEEEFLIH